MGGTAKDRAAKSSAIGPTADASRFTKSTHPQLFAISLLHYVQLNRTRKLTFATRTVPPNQTTAASAFGELKFIVVSVSASDQRSSFPHALLEYYRTIP